MSVTLHKVYYPPSNSIVCYIIVNFWIISKETYKLFFSHT